MLCGRGHQLAVVLERQNVAHQKSRPRKSSWICSGISQWISSGIFRHNFTFVSCGFQRTVTSPVDVYRQLPTLLQPRNTPSQAAVLQRLHRRLRDQHVHAPPGDKTPLMSAQGDPYNTWCNKVMYTMLCFNVLRHAIWGGQYLSNATCLMLRGCDA